MHRKEFRAWAKELNKTEFRSVTIDRSELYRNTKDRIWEDENKELIINGELFDVTGMEIIKDKAVLTLLPDKKEKALKTEFAGLFKEDTASSGGLFKLLKQLLSLKFIQDLPLIDLSLYGTAIEYDHEEQPLPNVFHPVKQLPPALKG